MVANVNREQVFLYYDPRTGSNGKSCFVLVADASHVQASISVLNGAWLFGTRVELAAMPEIDISRREFNFGYERGW